MTDFRSNFLRWITNTDQENSSLAKLEEVIVAMMVDGDNKKAELDKMFNQYEDCERKQMKLESELKSTKRALRKANAELKKANLTNGDLELNLKRYTEEYGTEVGQFRRFHIPNFDDDDEDSERDEVEEDGEEEEMTEDADDDDDDNVPASKVVAVNYSNANRPLKVDQQLTENVDQQQQLPMKLLSDSDIEQTALAVLLGQRKYACLWFDRLHLKTPSNIIKERWTELEQDWSQYKRVKSFASVLRSVKAIGNDPVEAVRRPPAQFLGYWRKGARVVRQRKEKKRLEEIGREKTEKSEEDESD